MGQAMGTSRKGVEGSRGQVLTQKICKHDGPLFPCNRPVVAKGYCQMHYARLRNNKPMDSPNDRVTGKNDGVCKHDGPLFPCSRKAWKGGYCVAHYARSTNRNFADMDSPIRGTGRYRVSKCSVDGCKRKHYGRGLCKYHYKRSDFYRESNQVSRLRRLGASYGGSRFSHLDRLFSLRYKQQNGMCAYCSEPFKSLSDAHMEHVIALAIGGEHVESNIVLACSSCNQTKATKRLYLDWIPPNPLDFLTMRHYQMPRGAVSYGASN